MSVAYRCYVVMPIFCRYSIATMLLCRYYVGINIAITSCLHYFGIISLLFHKNVGIMSLLCRHYIATSAKVVGCTAQKVKIKFTQEQAMKVKRGSKDIALLFLYPKC